MDEMIGHDFIVTSFTYLIRHLQYAEGKSFLPPSLKKLISLELFPNMAIRHLRIGVPGMLINDCLTQLIQRISNEIPVFPQLRFPHVLKRLECFEPLSQNIFKVFAPMTNLKYLDISLFSLASLSEETCFENLGTFRDLTFLKISNSPTYPEFNSTSAIPSLNIFLKNVNAPKITVLDIAYPILSLVKIEEDSTQFLINFISKSPTIKKLSISVCSPNQNFSPPSKQFEYPLTLLEQMATLGKCIQVESVELRDNHLHSLRPSIQTKAWIVFIKQQKKLRYVKFYLKSSLEFTGDIVSVVENNLCTLEKLDLSCFPCEIGESGDVNFVPIDGRCFSECKALRVLMLSDKTINTAYLPNSLNYIYVDAMLTNMDVHSILLSSIPNLNKIELKDTRGGAPKGYGYGVTNGTLKQFISAKRVHRLIIYAGSTDEKFPSEGIPNGDDVHPKILRKRKIESPLINPLSTQEEDQVRIDWHLNEWGFYENKGYGPVEHSSRSSANTSSANHEMYQSSTLISSFQ